MDFPALSAFGTGIAGDLTAADAAALHEQVVAAAKQLPGALAASELTISSGAITATGWLHSVDTEGNAASDDLVKILPGDLGAGRLLMLIPENTGRVVTVKTQAVGVGRILLDGSTDFVMDAAHKRLLLYRVGNEWQEVMRVTHLPAGAPHGREVFTSSGSHTIQAETIWITAIGGGGGGGGGAGNNDDDPNTGTDGGNGGNGGASSFGAFSGFSASGGAGGAGGDNLGSGGSATGGLNLPGEPSRLGTPRGGYPLASPVSPSGVGYGVGGIGGNGTAPLNQDNAGGAGASGCVGAAIIRKPLTRAANAIAIGQVVTVTVGAGGTAGAAGTGTAANGSAGGAGSAGCVIVEW